LRVLFLSCYTHSKFINAADVDRITRASQLQIAQYENKLIIKNSSYLNEIRKIVEIKYKKF